MKPERAPGFSLKLNQPALVVGAVLLLVVLWNFWLPFAQDYFNQVTKATLPPNVDFYAYFTAGQRFNAGANPYYYGEAQPGSALISEYLYPPTFLPLVGALARLPYDAARTLWLGLYALVYLAAFTALAMGLPRAERLTFAGLGALLTATSFPLLLHIRNGQADVLVIGLALLSFSLYGRGKRGASALLLALAGLLKVSPLLLLIYYLLYLRDWRYTLAVLAAGVGLAGISLLAVPFHYYPEYVMYILPVVSGGTGYYLNQSLLKYLADNPLLAQGVSAAGLGLFALFAGWAGSQQRRADGFETTAAFILNLLVILVFQGKAWSMAYVWAILPCALVLTYLLHHAAKPWQLLAAGAASALMVAKIYGYPPLDSLNLLGALVMGGLLMVVCWPRTTKENGGVA